MYNYELALFEARNRAQETIRRTALHAALGLVPKPAGMRLFVRRVVRLPGAVEIRHPAGRAGQAAINRRLPVGGVTTSC